LVIVAVNVALLPVQIVVLGVEMLMVGVTADDTFITNWLEANVPGMAHVALLTKVQIIKSLSNRFEAV
jgi:hypothetical protein